MTMDMLRVQAVSSAVIPQVCKSIYALEDALVVMLFH